MRNINIGFLTGAEISNTKYCRGFFELTNTYLKQLLPNKYSQYEPIDQDFSLNCMDKVCSTWGVSREGVGFQWKGTNPNSLGYAAFNSKLGQSTVNLETEKSGE